MLSLEINQKRNFFESVWKSPESASILGVNICHNFTARFGAIVQFTLDIQLMSIQ